MAGNDSLARNMLIEITRKELLDEIKKYVVGKILNGKLIVKKNTPLDGWLIILPDEKYRSLFEEE